MYCTYCGAQLPENAAICMNCGCAVVNDNSKSRSRYRASAGSCCRENNQAGCFGDENSNANIHDNQTQEGYGPRTQNVEKRGLMALILLLLFGVIGIHRMYVGKVWSGLVMMLIFAVGYSSMLVWRMSFGLVACGNVIYHEIPNMYLLNPWPTIWVSTLFFIPLLVWWVVDLVSLLSGKFTDSKGFKIQL